MISYPLECLAMSITPAVTQLFSISIQRRKLPEEWKIARVTLISKSHNKYVPENYRPIFLLSVFSKLLKMHVCMTFLINHLEKYHPLSAGCLQSLDWTGGLTLKIIFLRFLTRLTHLWSCVQPSL